MNKISKMYISIGYCCLGKTVWQGQVTLFLGLCWPCVSLCVRVPCEGWERQADQQHMGLWMEEVCCHFVLGLAFCFNCRCFPSIFTGSEIWEDKPGMVAHTCKSISGKLSQEDFEFEDSLGYRTRPGVKNKQFNNPGDFSSSTSGIHTFSLCLSFQLSSSNLHQAGYWGHGRPKISQNTLYQGLGFPEGILRNRMNWFHSWGFEKQISAHF